MGNQLFTGRKSFDVVEINVLDLETVLTHEAFLRDSPRPNFLGSLIRTQTRFYPRVIENWGDQGLGSLDTGRRILVFS